MCVRDAPWVSATSRIEFATVAAEYAMFAAHPGRCAGCALIRVPPNSRRCSALLRTSCHSRPETTRQPAYGTIDVFFKSCSLTFRQSSPPSATATRPPAEPSFPSLGRSPRSRSRRSPPLDGKSLAIDRPTWSAARGTPHRTRRQASWFISSHFPSRVSGWASVAHQIQSLRRNP
jgi:hypothetical protein